MYIWFLRSRLTLYNWVFGASVKRPRRISSWTILEKPFIQWKAFFSSQNWVTVLSFSGPYCLEIIMLLTNCFSVLLQLMVASFAILLLNVATMPYLLAAAIPIVAFFLFIRNYYLKSAREIKRLEAMSKCRYEGFVQFLEFLKEVLIATRSYKSVSLGGQLRFSGRKQRNAWARDRKLRTLPFSPRPSISRFQKGG